MTISQECNLYSNDNGQGSVMVPFTLLLILLFTQLLETSVFIKQSLLRLLSYLHAKGLAINLWITYLNVISDIIED